MFQITSWTAIECISLWIESVCSIVGGLDRRKGLMGSRHLECNANFSALGQDTLVTVELDGWRSGGMGTD